eukprot:SAG22_NODE_67_length_22882_cov_25.671553_12_plen_100_part_00
MHDDAGVDGPVRTPQLRTGAAPDILALMMGSLDGDMGTDPALEEAIRSGGEGALIAATSELSGVLRVCTELVDSDRKASRAVRNGLADRAEATQVRGNR